MTRRGWTLSPCPACGTTEGRPKDKLCFECQHIYDDGLIAIRKQKEQKQKIMVSHSKVSHWISRPYIFDHSANYVSNQISRKLHKAWSVLTMSVLEQAVGSGEPELQPLITNKKDTWGTKGEYGYSEYFMVEPAVRDALNEYDLAIRLSMEYAYLTGRKESLNLLLNLNSGIESSAKMEESIGKLDKRIGEIKGMIGSNED